MCFRWKGVSTIRLLGLCIVVAAFMLLPQLAFSVTLPSGILSYVPIHLSNSQNTPYLANTQIQVTINASAHSSNEASNLDNIEFFYANGTIIPSWMEGNSTISANGMAQRASSVSSSSTNVIYWLMIYSANKLLPALSSNDVYMGLASTSTNLFDGMTGEAPELSASYGQYDDGANVFNYYNPNPTASGFTFSQASAVTSAPLNYFLSPNALSVESSTGSSYAYSTNPAFTASNIVITYWTDVVSSGLDDFYFDAANGASSAWDFRIDERGSANPGFFSASGWGGGGGSGATNSIIPPSGQYLKVDIAINGLAANAYWSTENTPLGTFGANVVGPQTIAVDGNYFGISGDISGGAVSSYATSIIVRTMPPGGVLASSYADTNPVVSLAYIAADENAPVAVTANVNGGLSPYTYNYMIYNGNSVEVANFLYTGMSTTSNSITFTQNQAWGTGIFTANLVVTDSYGKAGAMARTYNSASALSLGQLTPSNTVMDSGQSTAFNFVLSGGTGPFNVMLVASNGLTLQTLSNQIDGTIQFNAITSPAGHDSYNAIVNDIGTTPVYISSTASNSLTVYNAPTISISFNSPIITQGQTVAYTVNVPLNVGGPTPFAVNVFSNGQLLATNTISAGGSITGTYTPNAGDYSFSANAIDAGVTTPYRFNSTANQLTVKTIKGITLPLGVFNFTSVDITNTQNTPYQNNSQIEVLSNARVDSNHEASNLDNIEFFYANGTIIPSWLEGNSSLTASGTTQPVSSVSATSTNVIYWLRIYPANSFLPAYSSNNIYMGFAPKTTNLFNNTINGEAPELSASYGQYDDGANVFSYYLVNPTSMNGFTERQAGLDTAPPAGQYLGDANVFQVVGGSFNYLYSNTPAMQPNMIVTYWSYMPSGNFGDFLLLEPSSGSGGYASRLQVGQSTLGIVQSGGWGGSWSSYVTNTAVLNPNSWIKVDDVIMGGELTAHSTSLSNTPIGTFGQNSVSGGIVNDGNYFGFQTDQYGVANQLYGAVIIRKLPPNDVPATVNTTPLGLVGTVLTISNSIMDSGQKQVLTASWSGGAAISTANYIMLNSTGSVCSQQTYNGISATSNTYAFTLNFNACSQNHYLIANVIISSGGQSTTISNSFHIYNSIAAGIINPNSPTIDSGQSVTLHANVIGGAPAYAYKWYTSSTGNPGCSAANQITGSSSTLSISPTTGNDYSYKVTDSATANSVTCSSFDAVNVNPALAESALSVSNSVIDGGQYQSTTAEVTGGQSPYTYNIFVYNPSGTMVFSSSQSSSSTSNAASFQQNPSWGTGTFTVNAVVTDGGSSSVANSMHYTAKSALQILSFTISNTAVSPPQYETFSATVSGGNPSYTYNFVAYNSIGTLMTNQILSGASTTATNTFQIISNTVWPSGSYTANVAVTDSATTFESASSSLSFVVCPGVSFTGTPSNSAIDANQFETLTVNVIGCVGPYTYNYVVTNPSGTMVFNSLFRTSEVLNTITINPNSVGVWTINAIVTDSENVPATYSQVFSYNVQPDTGVSITPTANTLDSGQSVTLAAHASGGTTPYSYQWYSSSSGSATCAGTPIAGAAAQSYAASPASTANYAVEITDSASTQNSACSPSASVTVNPAMSISSISPSNIGTDIGSGGTITLTDTASGGTPDYTMNWSVFYSGSLEYNALYSGVSSINGNSLALHPGTLGTGRFNANLSVTDNANTPEKISSSNDTVTINSNPSVNLALSSNNATNGTSVTFYAVISMGTGPFNVIIEAQNGTVMFTKNGISQGNDSIGSLSPHKGSHEYNAIVTDYGSYISYGINSTYATLNVTNATVSGGSGGSSGGGGHGSTSTTSITVTTSSVSTSASTTIVSTTLVPQTTTQPTTTMAVTTSMPQHAANQTGNLTANTSVITNLHGTGIAAGVEAIAHDIASAAKADWLWPPILAVIILFLLLFAWRKRNRKGRRN